MVKQAARFVLCNGPVTAQDRWEEDAGYSPFTLGVCITALLVAAEMLTDRGDIEAAAFLRVSADAWNDSIERWTYVTGTALAKACDVEGYYVRIGSAALGDSDDSPLTGPISIKNRADPGNWVAGEIVSTDALALVRFGLRSAKDPRILNTVKVIDHLLRIELPNGPVWRRYNEDGYGEHADGHAFDGTGIGRGWPLLTGERAHYELAAGNFDEAKRLLTAMESCANDGLLPEQVWDQDDIPKHGLYRGRPCGSAMPLVWAHAEHIKLLRSIADRQVFDMPPMTVKRYIQDKTVAAHMFWRFSHRCRTLGVGKNLRIEVLAESVLRWTIDGWSNWQEKRTRDSGLGLHFADVPASNLAPGATIEFTFFWPSANHWEGQNFSIEVVG